MMSKKKAYVVHPITAEQKAELVGKGMKIVDAKFAPKGADIIDLSEPVKRQPAKK